MEEDRDMEQVGVGRGGLELSREPSDRHAAERLSCYEGLDLILDSLIEILFLLH